MCFKKISKKNLDYSTYSLLISLIEEIMVCLAIGVTYFFIVTDIFLAVVFYASPITFICKMILTMNVFIFKKLMVFGVSIPVNLVDGGFGNKIDSFADSIPGL
jgi:hypothetical protein